MARRLGFGGSTQSVATANGAVFAFLTDNATPDFTLNEDYSSGAVDAYYTAIRDTEIYLIKIVGGIASLAQTTDTGTTFLGTTALTNGLKFAIKDSSGTVVQDLTVSYPLRNTADLFSFSSSSTVNIWLNSGTAANNDFYVELAVNCTAKFGAPLYLPQGYQLVCTLNDDLSGLTSFLISLGGRNVVD